MLALVRADGPLSRAEVARRTGLSLPTVAAIVRALEEDGLVRLTAPETGVGMVGRPSPIVELNPEGAFVLAMDVGATVTRLALVDLIGRPVREATAPTPGADPAASLRDLARMAAGLIAGAGTPRLQGIAVGVPGYVTADRRTVRLASNLPGWRDLAVAAAFEQALGAPCILDNDVNMAAIGEGCFGAARGIRDYIFLDLGTGIGAGVVIGGQVHRGVHGLGGELALSAVVGEDGQLRSIEADTAGWSLTEHAHRLGYADVPALFRAAESGDDAATQTLEHAARCLALAVSNMCAVVDPALVVVGGGLVKGSDLFLDAMRAVLADRLPYPPRVARTRLADRAAVLGAATVALDTFSGVPISTGGVAG